MRCRDFLTFGSAELLSPDRLGSMFSNSISDDTLPFTVKHNVCCVSSWLFAVRLDHTLHIPIRFKLPEFWPGSYTDGIDAIHKHSSNAILQVLVMSDLHECILSEELESLNPRNNPDNIRTIMI